MLFEVVRKSSSKKSYLFGTMHARSERAYTFYNEAKDLLSEVNVFAAEINFSDPALSTLNELFLLPDNQMLSDYLSPQKLEKYRKGFLKYFELDLDKYLKIQPLYLMNQAVLNRLSQDHASPLDFQLYSDALKLGLEIDGLESIEDQKNIVSQLELGAQFKQLDDLIRKPSLRTKQLAKVERAYSVGDIKSIYHLGKRSIGPLRRVLLKQRNVKMAKSFVRITEEKSVFAAVGAAHLYGKKGLIKLIKDQGGRVNRIDV